MASWVGEDSRIDSSAEKRPGKVNFYVLHGVKIKDNGVTMCWLLYGGIRQTVTSARLHAFYEREEKNPDSCLP